MGYPVINKRLCRTNRTIRGVQKEDRKQYKTVRGGRAKAKIYKVVRLNEGSNYVNLDIKQPEEKPQQEKSQRNKKSRGLNIESVIATLKENNLEGLSGGGYQVADKIRTLIESKESKRILLINSVECDPGLIHDSWLMENRFEDIKEGIEVLNAYIGFDSILIATKVLKKSEGKIQFVQVPNRYPMGEEHMLIEFVTGKTLKKEEIPAKHGILTMNIQTVYTLGQIVKYGYNNTGRYLTVANLFTSQATVVCAPYGMRIRTLLEKVCKQAALAAYSGGGVMNAHPVIEGECVDVHTNFVGYQEPIRFNNQNPCKNCGACARKCPAQLPVNVIVKAMERGNKEEAQIQFKNTCIKCGSCTFYCRANKNVMEIIESMNL